MMAKLKNGEKERERGRKGEREGGRERGGGREEERGRERRCTLHSIDLFIMTSLALLQCETSLCYTHLHAPCSCSACKF